MNYNYNMQSNMSPNTMTGIGMKTKHEMDKMEIINKIL